ncbi:MAG: PAS domain S-box protein [Thermodesulfobacteriota bacterium]
MAFLAIYGADRLQVNLWQKNRSQELESALKQTKVRLEESMKTRFDILKTVSALFNLYPETSSKEFHHFASLLMSFSPPVRALQFADSNTKVKYVYPVEKNEITLNNPMVLLENKKRAPYTKKAIKTKKCTIQGPFELRQGGSGVVVRCPIFRKNNFEGLAIGVYDLSAIIEETFKSVNSDKFVFSITDSKGNKFWNPSNKNKFNSSLDIKAADLTWTISASWKNPPEPPVILRILIIIFGIGLISIALYLILFSWRQEKILKKMVDERTSEIKKTNEALKKSEERFDLAMQFSNDGIFDWNLLDNSIYYSPGWKKMLGYEDHELENDFSQWEKLTPEEDVKASWKMLNELFEGKRDRFEIEFRMKHKNGWWVNILARANVIFDNNGKATRVVGTHIDITQRKKAEESLRKHHERFLKVLDSIDAAIHVADLDTCEILFMNKYMKETFGRDMTGENCLISLKQQSGPPQSKSSELLFDSKGNPSGVHVWQAQNPNTGRIYVNHDRAIEWTDGRLARIQIATDITELVKIEEQLRHNQKIESIGRLAGGVAHDFNNMLSIIIGNTEMVYETMEDENPYKNHLIEIKKASKRSAELTKQLLAFARKQTIDPKILDLNTTIEKMLQMLKRLIGENINLKWTPEDNLWNVKIDPTQLDQLLVNLCVNSKDAIIDVGEIEIGTKNIRADKKYCQKNLECVPGEYVMIYVHDTGSGMDSKTIENLFEPFFTTKDLGKGTGLGLATVHGIVKQNNGFIDVYSKPDEGTDFMIYLPRFEGEEKINQANNNDKETESGSETILLVEDEESIMKMTSLILEKQGYNVITTTKANEAIKHADTYTGKIDLLITDVIMPEMNGKDLADKLQKKYPSLECLFMSGYTANVIAGHGVLENDMNFIQKPFTKKELLLKIREILDR